MAQIIELPDGTELEFPEDLSDEQIRAAISANFPQFAPKAAPVAKDAPQPAPAPKTGSAFKAGRGGGIYRPPAEPSKATLLDGEVPAETAARAAALTPAQQEAVRTRLAGPVNAGPRPVRGPDPVAMPYKPDNLVQTALNKTLRKPMDESLGGAALETVGDIARGVTRAPLTAASGLWGLVDAGATQLGADGVADFANRQATDRMMAAEQYGNRVDPNPVFQGAAESLTQAAVGRITGLVAVTAGNEYNESIARGLKPNEALERASVMGLTEAIGERFGTPQLANLLRKSGASSTRDFRNALVDVIAKDIGGELGTYTMQSAYEKYADLGMKKGMTAEQFVDGALGTVQASLAMSTLAAGTAAAGRKMRAGSPSRLAAEEIDAAQPQLGAAAPFTDSNNILMKAGQPPSAPPAPAAVAPVEQQPTTVITPAEIMAAPVPQRDQAGDAPAAGAGASRSTPAAPPATVAPIDLNDPTSVLSALGVNGGQPGPVAAGGSGAGGAAARPADLAAVPGPGPLAGQPGAGAGAAAVGARPDAGVVGSAQPAPVGSTNEQPPSQSTNVRDLAAAPAGGRGVRVAAGDAATVAAVQSEWAAAAERAAAAGRADIAAQIPRDLRPVTDQALAQPLSEISAAISAATGFEGTTGKPVLFVESDSMPDGLNYQGRAVVNIKGMQKPAVFVAGHEISHTWQNLVEAADRKTAAGQVPTKAEADAKRIWGAMEAVVWDMIPTSSREAYAYTALGHTGTWAELEADPVKLREVRREMLADFHGKRLTDKATIEALAKREPTLFGDYAKSIVKWIDTAIAKLRGTKGGNLGASDVDKHIKDLTKAKLIWQDAMVSWRKRGGAAPVANDATPSASARTPQARADGETDKAFAKRVVDKRERPAELPETYDSYFKMEGAQVVPLSSLVSTKSAEQNQQGGDNGPKRMAAAAAGELSKRAPITVMPSEKEPGKYEVVDGNGTLTSVQGYGWKALPVKVVTRDEGAKAIAADKREEDLKRKAKEAAPFVGEALAREMVDAVMAESAVAETAFEADLLAKTADLAKPIMERAAQANDDFGMKLKRVAEELGAKAKHGPLKKLGRTSEKLADEYLEGLARNPDLKLSSQLAEETLKDLVRGSLIFNTEQQAVAAIETIRAKYDVLRVKDRFAKPLATGYRDILINVRLDNGTIAEIQLHIPGMFAAKDLGHEVYGVERAKPAGPAKDAMVDLQARYYGAAYAFTPNSLSRSDSSSTNSSSVAGAPLTTTVENPTGRPDTAEKNSRLSNEPTTGRPSTSNNAKPGSAALARQSNASATGNSSAEDAPSEQPIVNQGSLYVSRKVVNAQKLHDWAVKAGIKDVVPADKMHVTVVYSRAPVAYEDLGQAPASAVGVTGRLIRIGKDNDIALTLSAPSLKQRHAEALEKGASWDFAGGYTPHISLSYRDTTTDISKLSPPVMRFELGPEKAEPLKTGWADTMGEEAPSASAREDSPFELRTLKDGSLKVNGDVDAIRAALPDDVRGRKMQGGMLFSPSDSPRARAALEGRKLAYSRAGQVIDKLPIKDGKYVGAPEKFNTPQKIPQLRKILRQLAEEGAPGRFWYENSSKEVLQMVGGDVQEARKFVALLAIYSPQAKVDTNSTFALRAWSQFKAGQPISVKTKVMDDKATAALSDIDAFWSGEKTGNFFNNLLREIDPSVADKQGATIDMWMMRAAQYESDAPSSTQYAFMENENNRIAKELGWEPQQVQAAIWVAMKARTENKGVKKATEDSSEKNGWIRFDKNAKGAPVRVILNAQKHRDNWLAKAMAHDVTKSDTFAAKFDFSDGVRRHIGQVSWEARPGRSTGVLPGVNDAPYDQQVEFQQAVQKALYSEDGADLLAQQLGLLVDGPDILAPGVWQGEIAAGMQKAVAMAPGKGDDGKTVDPTQKQALDTYAAMLGLLLRQEGVGWHRPFYKGLKSAENGVELQIGRPFTPEEAQALWGATDVAMREAGVADWEQGAGLISSAMGMRLVNFGAVDNNTKFRDLIKTKVVPTLPFESVESIDFSSDGNLVTNDWKAEPNGQTYRQGISEAGRSDLLGWAASVLAPRVQSVFEEFSSKYGWGDPGRVEGLFGGQAGEADQGLSFSRRGPVSPQSALDGAIDNATRDLEAAIRLKSKTVSLGRTPHVLNMLGAKPMSMAIDPSIIDKVFTGKHADELRGVSVKDVVTGMYRPSMIFKNPAYPNDYELVLPVPTSSGPLTAIIVADPADGQAKVKSIYARSWKVRKEIDGRRHPSLGDFVGDKLKSKMVYFDEYSAPIAVTGNKDFRSEADRASAMPGRPLNKDHFLSYKDFSVKDRAERRAAKTEDDLLRWIGDNYTGDMADAPSFSARQPSLFRDELGRLRAPTGKLAAYYGGILNTWLAKVGMNYMSPELKRQFRAMKIQLQKAQEVTMAVAEQTFKMTEAERELVSDIVEGELKTGVVPPAHAVKMAMGMQAVLEQQTNELVSLGMLSQDSADMWRGKYLPRFYKPKLADTLTAWGKVIKELTGRKPIMSGIQGKRLKGRGLWETVRFKDLAEWEDLGWTVRDPEFDRDTARPSTEVQVWRDFTPDERQKMGEIRDAGFRFAMGYQQAQRDIAYGRLFQGIAATMGSAKEKPGHVQVPDGTVEGTGVKRYGALAGMWVPEEVLQHLKAMDSGTSPAMRAYRKAMSLWKEAKTVLNPVSHANNVLSNISMAHFAGVSYWDGHKYLGAIRDLVQGGAMVQEAKEAGLFLGTMNQEELVALLPPELQKLANTQMPTAERAAETAWNLLSFWLRRPMAAAYEGEDLFFRFLIYRDARSKGMTPADAVDYSQRYIFTYDDLPITAQRIRDFGLPFFAYTYKVVPALLHTAANYPHRLLAPAAILYGLNAAMYAMAAGDDDEDWLEKLKTYANDPQRRAEAQGLSEEERANLPPWMKGAVQIGAPKAIRLHTDEVLGLPVFWDVGQIMPGGNLFDLQNNSDGVALPQSITPSHPLFTTFSAMLVNKDMFLGKEIVDKNDTSAEAASKRAEWLWRQFTPAISYGNYHWERGLNIVAQQTGEPVRYWPWRELTGVDKQGMPITPGYAALQTVGIKVRPVDTERSAEMAKGQREALIRDIDKELRNFRRQNQAGFMSDAILERELERAQLKKERLREGLTVDGERPE